MHSYPISNLVDTVNRHAINSAMLSAPQGQNNDPSIVDTVGRIIDTVDRSVDRSNSTVSLFQYARSSIISSRMYIEETLASEPILPNFTRNVLNLYVGMILTALNLNRFTKDGRTVESMMGIVSTEAWKQAVEEKKIDIDNLISDYFVPEGSRRLLSDYVLDDYIFGQEASVNGPLPTNNPPPPPPKDTDTTTYELNVNETSTAKPLSLVPKDVALPCSAVIQLDLDTTSVTNITELKNDQNRDETRPFNRSKTNFSKSGTLNVMVQLRPQFIPSTVSKAFVDMNFTLSRHQRWLQFRTGEISFFKDFLMGCDIDKRYRKAMLDDKTGILKEMFVNQANSLNRHFAKMASNNEVMRKLRPGMNNNSVNIANTILVFDRKSFDQACSTSGVNFRRYDVRKRFFDKTYAMILAVIDPSYNRISMWYNGIPEGSEFTFNQININAKSEATDIVSIMKSYAANMAPKF